MNLAQALKTKNRLAGELNRLQGILRRENARRNDSVSTVDCSKVWEDMVKTSKELGEIKAKICRANIDIYPKLERMAESKSSIAFLGTLPIREGEEVAETYVSGVVPRTYQWISFITRETADAIALDLQKQIEALQDEIDRYNATTEI
jgi:hypothetical protein